MLGHPLGTTDGGLAWRAQRLASDKVLCLGVVRVLAHLDMVAHLVAGQPLGHDIQPAMSLVVCLAALELQPVAEPRREVRVRHGQGRSSPRQESLRPDRRCIFTISSFL